MYYSVEINNFKSIKKATAKFPSFAAIVGKNAAGKTNLIQAIKFIRDMAVGETTTEAQKSISLIPNELFNFNEGNNDFTIDLTIRSKDDSQYLLSIKIRLDNGTVKPATLIVNEEKLYKFINDNNKEEIYHRDKEGLKDKNSILIPISVDSNKLGLAVYKTPDTVIVKDEFINTVIPDIELMNNIESIALGSIGSEFDNLASIIVSLHHNHPENYDKFQIIIQKLLPHFSSVIEITSKDAEVSPSPEKESYLVVLEERNLKKQLSMQSVSSGDLKTLLLIAATMNMADHSTLIIEEIENGMHPKRIIDLIEHLETISRIKKMQIIFTTHSPIVINRLSPQEVILTERETDKGTLFTLLEESEQISKIKKYLQEGGNLIDYLHTTKY